MLKTNKSPRTREPKTTIKTLLGQIGTLAEQIREVNGRLNRLVEYDKEKQQLREQVEGLQNRLESSNEQAIASNARATVFSGIVERLLGKPDPNEVPERLRNGGDTYEIPHSRPPRQGRCGSCGRF